MAVRATPADATAKWVQNIGQATQRIQTGVQSVTRSPGAAAAAQRGKWLARIQQSADKWASRVGAVSLQEWQQAMISVGIPRIAQGAQAKQHKMENFMTEFLPYLAQGVARIDAMPSTTLEDSINRAAAMIRHNANFRRGGSGRMGGGA